MDLCFCKDRKGLQSVRRNQRDKAIGALLDCAGMVTCVLAISHNPFFADPIISTYFVFTALLSRFLLKEKLTVRQ